MRVMMIAAALAFGAAPALSQNVNVSQGLVDVTIQNVEVLGDFLNDAQVAALNGIGLPVTVQVPVGIAANACGVDANVLAKQKKDGTASCTAQNGSRALAQSVIKQKLSQND